MQANATQIALGRCAQHLAAHPEFVVVNPPAPPTPPPPPPAPWWHDTWGLRLSLTGAVGIAVGTGFVAAAYAARGDADDARGYAAYDERLSTAESRRTIGVTALAVGGALLAGGVVRFVLVHREARAQKALARGADLHATLSFGPGSLGLVGTF